MGSSILQPNSALYQQDSNPEEAKGMNVGSTSFSTQGKT
jgi:hypothetical protein